MCVWFFCFKQKTAYEMRIIDWSSDVCSSDLKFDHAIAFAQAILRADAAADLGHRRGRVRKLIGLAQPPLGGQAQPVGDMIVERTMHRAIGHAALRAARRLRVGIEIGTASRRARACQYVLIPVVSVEYEIHIIYHHNNCSYDHSDAVGIYRDNELDIISSL